VIGLACFREDLLLDTAAVGRRQQGKYASMVSLYKRIPDGRSEILDHAFNLVQGIRNNGHTTRHAKRVVGRVSVRF
jgi:hypothetical protein